MRELLGVPQLTFMNRGIIKLAKVAERNDWSAKKFQEKFDPTLKTQFTLDEFKSQIKNVEMQDL